MSNVTLCNNCAGTIVLSLGEHVEAKGLVFCCEECSNAFNEQDAKDQYPSGLAYDLGLEEGGW